MPEEEVISRSQCSYENQSQAFKYKNTRKFDLQYFNLYATRYKLLQPKLVTAAKAKWSDKYPVKNLVDLVPEEECIIIGLLFRKMALQPGILNEICDEENIMPIPVSEKYATDEDIVILEEQQQRIQIIGDINLPTILTGTGIAAYGYASGGKFHVKELSYPLFPKHENIALHQSLHGDEDKFVLFLSGLGIGKEDGNLMNLQLLTDMITGRICGGEDHALFSKVCRVVIAGNSLSEDTEDKDTEKLAKYLSRNTKAKSVSAVECLEDIVVQLGSCVPVDIMPGEFDPTNQFLPQQPMHKCMFPSALRYSTVQGVTNPYKACIGGRSVLGTSGQNVSNIYKFSGLEDRLTALETTLRCGHISPTSPDSLSCYPYENEDPFVLETCPDIYFAGNQPLFESKVLEEDGRRTLLLLVPTFHMSGVAVLVNLRDFSAHPITIDTSFT